MVNCCRWIFIPWVTVSPEKSWWPGAIHPGQDEEKALESFPQAWSRVSSVSGIRDMSDVPIAQGLKHCSLRDTEACLPRALCSLGWKQLISNCLHSNYLIVQKHCLVFQFSLSHCLPEGLFTALSLIWVGGMPVGEVNCQDRKNTMVARNWGAFSLARPTWTLDSVKTKVARASHFHICVFCLLENYYSLQQAQKYEDFSLFPWEAL